MIPRRSPHNQLAAQKIYLEPANSSEVEALVRADAILIKQCAGQLMTTGSRAEVWAEHFIAIHLHEIGLTYDQATPWPGPAPPTPATRRW